MPPAELNLEFSVRTTPEEIIAVLPNLPSSPNVLPRLCGLVHEGGVSLQELSNMLRLDPGLTARVLQTGAKLAAARGLHCFTAEDAVNLIGFNRINAMIKEVAKAQVFAHPINLYGLDAEEFWRWSVSCALAAELLAEQTGEDMSVAYTVGLLHNAGIVAIDEWALRKEPSLLFMPREVLCDFMESERALLGFTQADVGAALLRHWGFPVTITEPLHWQDAPLESSGYSHMACLLNAAKWLRTAVCATDDDRVPPLPEAAVMRLLRITPEQLVWLVVEVRIRLGRVRNLIEAIAA